MNVKSLFTWVIAGIFLLAVPAISKQQQFYIRYTKTTEKIVALTFDDGPHPLYTKPIIDSLSRYQVPATFFMLGKAVETYPDLALKVYQAGHDIGNHSYEHKNYKGLSQSEIMTSLARSQRAFFRTLGFFPTYFRPPYGDLKLEQIENLTHYFRLGIKWNVDSLDWRWHTNAQLVANQVLSNVSPGAIVLLHDTHPSTVGAVPIIIDSLKKRGYRFVRVSDLVHEGDLTPVWNQVL